MRWSKLWRLSRPVEKEFKCLTSYYDLDIWEKWELKTKKKYPKRFFFQETLKNFFFFTIPWKLKEIYWNIRYRTTDRYHVLNISSKENKWVRGYADVSDRMLYSCFSLLVNFVETSASGVSWEWNEDLLKVEKEMNLLYKWWMKERPKRNWEVSKHGQFEKEDSDNLIRLVNIREYLWS